MRGVSIPEIPAYNTDKVATVTPAEIEDDMQLVDIRTPQAYRDGHIDGAAWSIRPRFEQLGLSADKPVVLICGGQHGALAAQRCGELGCSDIRQLSGDAAAWSAAGLKVVPVTTAPAEDETINIVYHWQHRTIKWRHRGSGTCLSRLGNRPRGSTRRSGTRVVRLAPL